MALALFSSPPTAAAINAGHETLKAPGLTGSKGTASSFARRALHLPPLGRTQSLGSFAVSVKAQPQTSGGVGVGVLDLEEDLPEVHHHIGRGSFAKEFVFGAATAAYQIEGAAKEGGRGPSIWDHFTHKFPDKIADKSNGDVAADSYHRYKEDVQLLKDLGMDAYRFSLSWSRILPKGRGKINPEGIRYYNNLIDELLANGIEPYVTLFHWDLPQALDEEYGGFLGDKILEDYKNYVDICFKEFGDRVKNWITVNEPLMFTTLGYGLGLHAPGHCTDGLVIQPGFKLNCPVGGDSLREPYIVSHNILRAHSEAVHLYRKKYQDKQCGQIGITLVSHWMEPIDDTPLSKEAQERALQFNLGWFMDPLKFGEYPLWMRALVKERLPFFTPEESEKVKDSFDFIGLNYYTSRFARNRTMPKDFKPSTYLDDVRADITEVDNNGIPIDHAEPGSWINVHPRGLRELLLYIKRRYDNPPIYITENGVMEKDQKDLPLHLAVNDTHRAEYLTLHLHELKEAARRGVNLKGYFTWSLLDNFEWQDGFSSRLGLHYIDYYGRHQLHLEENEMVESHSPAKLRRIPKQSTVWFKRFLSIH